MTITSLRFCPTACYLLPDCVLKCPTAHICVPDYTLTVPNDYNFFIISLFRLRLQMVFAFVEEVTTFDWFYEETVTELAGYYGAGETELPGPFSIKTYAM